MNEVVRESSQKDCLQISELREDDGEASSLAPSALVHSLFAAHIHTMEHDVAEDSGRICCFVCLCYEDPE